MKKRILCTINVISNTDPFHSKYSSKRFDKNPRSTIDLVLKYQLMVHQSFAFKIHEMKCIYLIAYLERMLGFQLQEQVAKWIRETILSEGTYTLSFPSCYVQCWSFSNIRNLHC